MHASTLRRKVPAIGGVVILFAHLAGACASAPTSTPTVAPPTPLPPIETTPDLVAALEQAAGEPVTTRGPAPSEFGVQGQILGLGQETVEVYAFPDSAGRSTAQSEIDPSGPTFQGQPLTRWQHPRIWGVGRLLVVYDGSQGGTFLVLSGLLGDPLKSAASAAAPDEPYPPAVAAAIGALAGASGTDPSQIQVLGYEPAAWPNDCLGLPDPGETCAQGQVEGWKVTMMVNGDQVEVRTDDLGQRVRWRP